MFRLYRYFKKVQEPVDKLLPDPKGPLSAKIPSSSISKVNHEVKGILLCDQVETGTAAQSTSKRGPYTVLKNEQIAKRIVLLLPSDHTGYAQKFPNLRESSVRTCMEGLLQVRSIKKRCS